MSQLPSYLNELYAHNDLPDARDRRAMLILEMQELEGKTIHCYTCPGTCCTQAANSMLITPIEALELLQYLKADQFSPEEKENFKKRMVGTIKDYRLDVEIYTGKKAVSTFRKTYTCPFFNNGSLGCSVSRSAKPYGCLGFNPKTNEDNGKSCASNTDILEKRDNIFIEKENVINQKIRDDFKLSWTKKNIPEALLEILEKYEQTF